MRTIKTTITVLLLTIGMTAKAQQVMTVKTAGSNDKYELTTRFVLDLTGQKPIVRVGSQRKTFASGTSLLMYLMPTDDETYQIIDGAVSFYNPEDRFYKQITYTRDFQNLDWQILYLPLRLQFDEWDEDFEIARINDVHQFDTNLDGCIDDTELEVVLLRDGHTEPNTPYVIRARRIGKKTIIQNGATLYASEQIEKTVSSWNTDFTIRGTYSLLNASSLPSGTFYTMESNSLGMGTGDGQVGAFRWYVIVTDRENGEPTIQKIRIREFSTDPDAIADINANNSGTSNIYDLSGRRVSHPVKGIYIQNGKKTLIR